MNMPLIGIFPLNIVLFPESAYPLHIFEDRYKLLINKCDKEKIEFGVNYINNQGISHVGCTAIVSDIIQLYPDGRMDVLIAGIERYKILHFSDGKTPYYTAEVVFFADEKEIPDDSALDNCIEIFNQIADNINTVKIDKIKINDLKTNNPSYFIAQKSGMTPEQRQKLLEIRSENARINILINHLQRLLPIVRDAETVTKIIKNDGYLKPNIGKY
jgi:Lon protease-like protein